MEEAEIRETSGMDCIATGIHQIAKIFAITLWDGVTATSNVEMSVQLCY